MNWGALAGAGIALISLIGSLMGYLLNAKIEALKAELNNKIDYSAVAALIEASIDRYHTRIVADLKRDVAEKHRENTEKLDEESKVLSEVKEKVGEILGILGARRYGPPHL